MNSLDRAAKARDEQAAFKPNDRFDLGDVGVAIKGYADPKLIEAKKKDGGKRNAYQTVLDLLDSKDGAKFLKSVKNYSLIEMARKLESRAMARGKEVNLILSLEDKNFKYFLGAIRSGKIVSEGFDTAINCSAKVYFVNPKNVDNIYLKVTASGKSMYHHYEAITSMEQGFADGTIIESELEQLSADNLADPTDLDLLSSIDSTATAYDIAMSAMKTGITAEELKSRLPSDDSKYARAVNLYKAMLAADN